jgi:hypothetical protein
LATLNAAKRYSIIGITEIKKMQILFCGRVRLSCILKEAGASVTQFLGRPNSNSLASSNLPYCEQALHPLDPEEEFLLGVMEKQIICAHG